MLSLHLRVFFHLVRYDSVVIVEGIASVRHRLRFYVSRWGWLRCGLRAPRILLPTFEYLELLRRAPSPALRLLRPNRTVRLLLLIQPCCLFLLGGGNGRLASVVTADRRWRVNRSKPPALFVILPPSRRTVAMHVG